MQNVLHDKAIQLAKTYKESESQLLAVLMQMQEEKIFLRLNYVGIFDYCVKALELSEAQEAMLKKVQDLVSQKTGRAASLQDALDHMAKCYLDRHDPIRKAERASSRKERAARPQNPGRRPIPATIEHQVHLRDRFQCTAIDSRGKRCTSTRWLQLHHILPVARGGKNEVDNLTTLCQFHHRRWHEVKPKTDSFASLPRRASRGRDPERPSCPSPV